ncbi:MAG: nucleotidyl transferase AbiEii/AbiGii toxin family protein [Bacteroidales bacterium]|nr:nucleotidyl transferase AbiEii/AbiGii toxin family protein [Bacteroidales bacterium]
MLQTQAVDAGVLGLIKRLQSLSCLQGFYLVGGTALALYLGHRKSIDIDLFNVSSFDEQMLLDNLSHELGFELYYSSKNTLKGSIGDVKIDVLAHRYPLIGDLVTDDGITLLSIPDIAAMKLNAVSLNGQRVKDFIDIYFLLEHFSIREMLGFYRKKYTHQNDAIVLKSLVWFGDVELADWPVIINEPRLSWPQVKKRLLLSLKEV